MWVFGWTGESGFSARSTAEQVTAGIDGTGLTAIVTGASCGLGLETTRVLALRGVQVVMAVRNVDAGYEARRSIMDGIPTAKLEVMRLDLSSLASVRNFASEFVSTGLPLNILIYFGMSAYGQSKLANILHAKELARRLQEDGVNITVNSLHPGSIVTNLLRHHSVVNGLANLFVKFALKNAEQGAATSCYLALHPQVKGVTGKHFMDCNLAEPNSLGKDMKLAKKLWEFSLSLIHQART
ncbi:unnamed protein product [Linum tenue]|uniref:Short-chain dehydrogenase TIC 32, chloroplastic n=1 Tax=Linum tenue TaxID=586396 RepID=A0AAV0Q118_9ROSI|nr:unnamed protein product [Linum tenue]